MNSIEKNQIYIAYLESLTRDVGELDRKIESAMNDNDEKSFNNLRDYSFMLKDRLTRLESLRTLQPLPPTSRIVDFTIAKVVRIGTEQSVFFFFLPVAGDRIGAVYHQGRNITVCGRDHKLFGQAVGFKYDEKGKMEGYDRLTNDPRHFQIDSIL